MIEHGCTHALTHVSALVAIQKYTIAHAIASPHTHNATHKQAVRGRMGSQAGVRMHACLRGCAAEPSPELLSHPPELLSHLSCGVCCWLAVFVGKKRPACNCCNLLHIVPHKHNIYTQRHRPSTCTCTHRLSLCLSQVREPKCVFTSLQGNTRVYVCVRARVCVYV